MAKKSNENGSLRNIIAIVAVVTSGVTATVAVRGCQHEEGRANTNARRIEQLEKQVQDLNSLVNEKDAEIAKQQVELARSLDAYIRHYRDRIISANEAIQKYKDFDTAGNRAELGAEFEKRHAALLAEAKDKLRSLVDHVERWKPVLKALEQAMNGRVLALKDGLAKNDPQEILSRFATLRDNIDADIELLRRALDAAASSKSPNQVGGSNP